MLWFGGVAAGLSVLAAYDNRAGAAATAVDWPAETALARAADRPTLILLAHPRCTCTRASLAELAEVMARAARPPRAYVLFVTPTGVASGWAEGDLWRTASAISHVTVIRDDRGLEARRFGAQTSGQVLLYDADGRLIFGGGATGARGHIGDNPGRAALIALLNQQPATRDRTPVFGCPLFAPRDRQDARASDSGHAQHSN